MFIPIKVLTLIKKGNSITIYFSDHVHKLVIPIQIKQGAKVPKPLSNTVSPKSEFDILKFVQDIEIRKRYNPLCIKLSVDSPNLYIFKNQTVFNENSINTQLALENNGYIQNCRISLSTALIIHFVFSISFLLDEELIYSHGIYVTKEMISNILLNEKIISDNC